MIFFTMKLFDHILSAYFFSNATVASVRWVVMFGCNPLNNLIHKRKLVAKRNYVFPLKAFYSAYWKL